MAIHHSHGHPIYIDTDENGCFGSYIYMTWGGSPVEDTIVYATSERDPIDSVLRVTYPHERLQWLIDSEDGQNI